jgi:hypothetical protein
VFIAETSTDKVWGMFYVQQDIAYMHDSELQSIGIPTPLVSPCMV